MAKIICTIPEHSLSQAQILTLEAALRQMYHEHFGRQSAVDVFWSQLPEGQSYVAGAADEVYIVLVEAPDGLEQPRREAALTAFAATFAEHAGIDLRKPLISVLDSAKVREYLRENRRRLKMTSRPGFLLGTLMHAILSRRRDGFASIRTNL